MSDFFRKISNALGSFRRNRAVQPPEERRRAPRFICSAPVLWEVGREQGEGRLREVSSTGLRLQTKQAFLAGKHIRVRPLTTCETAPLSTDVAIGTIVYSRFKGSGYDVGVELINPERMSRFAWIGQLTRQQDVSSIPQAVPKSGQGLTLVGGTASLEKLTLLSSEAMVEKEKKIQKNKGNE
jgi:PilZ domain